MTTSNHGNTRLTPCTCQRQLNQEHRRSRTRRAPRDPHVAGWLGATRGHCATLLRACQCRPTPPALPLLQTSVGRTPKLAAVVHRRNGLAKNAIAKYVLWKSNSLEMIKRKKSPSACSVVWIVASDKAIHSRASPHKPVRCAKSSLHAASTHSCTTCNCRHLQVPRRETVRRFHVLARLAGLDLQGQAHVNNDDGHRTSATEDVRDVGQRIVLARALLLDVPIRKLHATR